MKAFMLNNAMFDDGSIVYKNFIVKSNKDFYSCEWTWIQRSFSGRIQRRIIEAITQGKRYINLDANNPVEKVMGREGLVIEISWD